jgi:hypothetical protein
MQIKWIATPYRRQKEECYAEVPTLGRLDIKRRSGGFRIFQNGEPIGPIYPRIEVAIEAATRFARVVTRRK